MAFVSFYSYTRKAGPHKLVRMRLENRDKAPYRIGVAIDAETASQAGISKGDYIDVLYDPANRQGRIQASSDRHAGHRLNYSSKSQATLLAWFRYNPEMGLSSLPTELVGADNVTADSHKRAITFTMPASVGNVTKDNRTHRATTGRRVAESAA